MIVKNEKQIGFIYKNNKKIDKIIKNGKILFEQGFSREKESNDLPITFNGIGKDLKNYKIDGKTKQGTLLPKQYTQVGYIESNGSQYINTGFIPNNETSYVIDIEVKNLDKLQYIISSHSDYRNNIYVNSSNYFCAGYGSIYKTSTEQAQINTRYKLYLNKNLFYINNDLALQLSEQSFTNTLECILFAQNKGNNNISNFSDIRIYSCKIYDNDTLVRNFIPCYRDSDNEVGLYDLIDDIFYTNARNW